MGAMILQLAKTTPYLSGQFKLDIELFSKDGKTVTGGCHASPLSDKLGETDSTDASFFNYSLAENIRQLCSRLGDQFFWDSPSLSSEEILYAKDGEWIDRYDHTYQAGVSRMRFGKYGKQFSLLCPIWIEDKLDWTGQADTANTGRPRFVITIQESSSPQITTSTEIEFSKDLYDSIAEYLNGISSDLVNINLDRNEIYATGLDVPSGSVITKEVSHYLKNMLDRERPVIETDSMLCQILPTNKMIARQILNLNFCFNINDIMSGYLSEEMNMRRWKIWIDIYIGNKKAEFKDIYTNYWTIPSYIPSREGGSFDQDRNALEYLDDHRCVDYIFKNKSSQPIFHWSLVENRNYMFNFYNGFSPVIENADGDMLANGLFYSQPNPFLKEYRFGFNTLNWCKATDLTANDDISAALGMLGEDSYTKFPKEAVDKVRWINGMKFDFDGSSLSEQNFKYGIILANPSAFNVFDMSNDPGFAEIRDDNNHVIAKLFFSTVGSEDRVNIILNAALTMNETINTLPASEIKNSRKSLDCCTLFNILNSSFTDKALAAIINNNTLRSAFEYINNYFSHYVYPWDIEFNKSLYAARIDSPDSNSEEMQYYKSDINHSVHVYRYTGSISPMFVSLDDAVKYNYDFFYRIYDRPADPADTAEKEILRKYNEYLKTGFRQIYPSVNFFPLRPEKSEYTTIPSFYQDIMETKWYKDGRIYDLPEKITDDSVITVPSSGYIGEDYIYQKLRDHLRAALAQHPYSGYDPSHFEMLWNSQLKNLYKYKTEYDYESDTDITRLRFRTEYTLR